MTLLVAREQIESHELLGAFRNVAYEDLLGVVCEKSNQLELRHLHDRRAIMLTIQSMSLQVLCSRVQLIAARVLAWEAFRGPFATRPFVASTTTGAVAAMRLRGGHCTEQSSSFALA